MPTEKNNFKSKLNFKDPVGRVLTQTKGWSKKKLVLLLGTLASLLVSAALWMIISRNQPQDDPAPSEAIPTPTVTRIISPSEYATDSAVLKIESEINEIEKRLQEVDLHETTLNPPLLDMNVEF